MRVKLNYVEPPIKCFLHHAFLLGVFWDENNAEVMKWFCVNYNYMFGSRNLEDCCYTYLVNYSNVPFLQRREIYGDELEKYLSKNSFAQMAKTFIDNGNFVEVIVDLFYLPTSEAYGVKHDMHEILISGYDDEKESFIVVGYFNHRFIESEIDQSKIVPFEKGAYYGDDVVVKLYRRREGNFHFTVNAFMIQIRDFYESINPYDHIGNMFGNYFSTWERDFGFEAYHRMLDYLRSKERVDYRILRLIQEHFDGMKRKFTFLHKMNYDEINDLDEMITFYTMSASNAEKIVLLGVKQSMTQDKEKSIEIKEKVIEQLEKLIAQEKQMMKVFLERN